MLEFKALGPEQKDQLKSHRGKAMKGDNWGCAVEKGDRMHRSGNWLEVRLGVGEKEEPGETTRSSA